ncbi:MAG: hypothetical protein SGPRY_013508, partial [Prymnesium sp.]
GLRQAKLELKKSQRKDLYKLLGTTKHASDHEIKKAYRKQAATPPTNPPLNPTLTIPHRNLTPRSALQYHPDRHSNASEAEKAEAEKKFKEIGEAFDILSNPEKKASPNGPMTVSVLVLFQLRIETPRYGWLT